MMADLALQRSSHDKSEEDFNYSIKKRLHKMNIYTPLSTSNPNTLNNDKKQNIKHKVKKITDLQSAGRSSYFVNPPNTVIWKSMLKVTLVILLSMIPRIVNFGYLIVTYKDISQGFIRMYMITAASQSIHTIQAYFYRDYNSPLPIGERYYSEDDAWIFSNSLSSFNDILSIEDEFIRNKLDSNQLCSYTIRNIASTLRNNLPEYRKFCDFVTRYRKNITMIETYHMMQNYQNKVKIAKRNPNQINSLKEFIESQDTAFVDGASYFLTVSLRSIGQEYLSLVQANMALNKNISLTIMIVSSLATVAMMIAYRRYWIKNRLRKWTELKGCFLILNNSLVDNEYIKSYFKCSLDRRFDDEGHENSLVDN